MAAITDIRNDFGIVAHVVETAKSLAARYAQHRAYRTTLNELSVLNSHELADLGLNRSMLRQVALEAAYGPQH